MYIYGKGKPQYTKEQKMRSRRAMYTAGRRQHPEHVHYQHFKNAIHDCKFLKLEIDSLKKKKQICIDEIIRLRNSERLLADQVRVLVDEKQALEVRAESAEQEAQLHRDNLVEKLYGFKDAIGEIYAAVESVSEENKMDLKRHGGL